MSEKRSQEMLLAGYFLSRCGRKRQPPENLGVRSWNEAYALFYPHLSAGRSPATFLNSLKNIRDKYDPHHDNERIGWRTQPGSSLSARPPVPLGEDAEAVLARWAAPTDDELWQAVASFCS